MRRAPVEARARSCGRCGVAWCRDGAPSSKACPAQRLVLTERVYQQATVLVTLTCSPSHPTSNPKQSIWRCTAQPCRRKLGENRQLAHMKVERTETRLLASRGGWGGARARARLPAVNGRTPYAANRVSSLCEAQGASRGNTTKPWPVCGRHVASALENEGKWKGQAGVAW